MRDEGVFIRAELYVVYEDPIGPAIALGHFHVKFFFKWVFALSQDGHVMGPANLCRQCLQFFAVLKRRVEVPHCVYVAIREPLDSRELLLEVGGKRFYDGIAPCAAFLLVVDSLPDIPIDFDEFFIYGAHRPSLGRLNLLDRRVEDVAVPSWIGQILRRTSIGDLRSLRHSLLKKAPTFI